MPVAITAVHLDLQTQEIPVRFFVIVVFLFSQRARYTACIRFGDRKKPAATGLLLFVCGARSGG